ncbi:glycosyltransferase [Pseudogemmobacter sp. CC-YST710]|uniref:Glycosyltransferase n=2 Tax=Pseudogemmobacter faecipullorum TaxID=2755041 RepID=A0ABS8CSH3_9RHOB|nr:glycosyltransferase [Pseudogemmobacter faecipullorum]
MDLVNIICVKWGTKYGADYVNKLHSMVRRNMSRPYRFVCFTDDAAGIAPGIETQALPKIGIPEFDAATGWTRYHGWLKATVFAAPLSDLKGPVLFLDVDIVITGPLDDFFDPPGAFLVIKEWDKRDETGNTSAFRFEAGAHGDLIAHLAADLQSAQSDYRNEQEFVTSYFSRKGLMGYWPKGWCVSFKRHCMHRGLMGFFRPARIPQGAKIVVFHGKPNPPDAIIGRSGKWYRRVLPVAWVDELWR